MVTTIAPEHTCRKEWLVYSVFVTVWSPLLIMCEACVALSAPFEAYRRTSPAAKLLSGLYGPLFAPHRERSTPCKSLHCARETGVTGVTTRRNSRFRGDKQV